MPSTDLAAVVLLLSADPDHGEIVPPLGGADRPHLRYCPRSRDRFEPGTFFDGHAPIFNPDTAANKKNLPAVDYGATLWQHGHVDDDVTDGYCRKETPVDPHAERDETAFKPTPMAFATFWNFVDDLASRPLPPQIDRSMVSNKSGTDQRNLIAALSSFELVGPPPKRRVEPALEALAAPDKEQRKAELGKLIRRFYPEAVKLSEANGTEQQLHDSFKDQFGLDGVDTRRKAITFFLHAARVAGIHISAYFPATRSGSGAPGTPRTRRPGKRKPAASSTPVNGDTRSQEADPAQGAASYSTEVTIGDGTILILTAKNPNPFGFSKSDRDFFFGLVDSMQAYASAQARPASNGKATDDSLIEDRVS